MKKFLYSLIALAGLLTAASCQPDKLVGGPAGANDGFVNVTIPVVLGPQTKAFADGTTVDKLYAGIYEVSGTNYTWVADNSDAPITISNKAGNVTFNGKIELGKSYIMVFWAQKQDAPYAINWAKSATTGPTVTVTSTGDANDENRDAFFGVYETGTVTGSIDLTGSPITLKRPFAQVNVLVPTANFVNASAAITSSMSIDEAPTVLNLATKETSDSMAWTFSASSIAETAFGSYASTHKYVAMNYVLVAQTGNPRYNVTFSVTCGTQSVADKALANIPLKPNGRTNVVGNIFDSNFNITVPFIIDPGAGTEQELTSITVAVGQNPGNAVALDAGYNADPSQRTAIPIEVIVSHPVEVEADKPQITVEPASVASAEWNLTTGKLDVTPLVDNGAAVITLVFPAVTKTEYSAATVQIYVKVGTGDNIAATPTFDPVAGAVAANSQVTIATTTPGAKIYYTMGAAPADPTAQSTLYEGPITITEATTIKAIAVADGFTNSAVAEAAYTIAPQAPTPLVMSTITCTNQTYNSLTFTWTTVDNADGYKVSLDEGNTYGDLLTTTSYTWTGLSASTTKTIYVKAIGSGAYSDSVAGTASGTTASPTPLVMSTITCTDQTVNSLTFGWEAVANADGYKVSLDEGNTYGDLLTTTSYTWTGLSASTTKTIYVKAIGSGAYSDSVAGTASGTTTAVQAAIPAGDYVVAVKSAEQYIPMTSTVESNRFNSAAAFAYTSGTVNALATNVWTLASTVGGYTLEAKAHAGQYVVFVSGQNQAGLSNTGSVLSFDEQQGGGYHVTVTDDATTRYLSKNTSGDFFAFYGNTSQNAVIYLIPAQVAEQVATPTITGENDATEIPAGEGTLSVTLACTTQGATIYYTKNGDTPTTSSAVYSTPISLSEACTVKAIAVKDNMIDSEVASKTFTKAGAAISYSTTYTTGNDVTVSVSSGNTSCKVSISADEYDAVKANKAATFTLTVPENTSTIHLFIAAWSGEGCNVTVTGGAISSAGITADAGISGNGSTYTLEGTISNYYKTITVNDGLTVTNQTVSVTIALPSNKRAVVWGVNAE